MSVLDRFRRRLTCEQLGEVLQSYLDGELEPSEVPKVLQHLEACKDCGLEASIYRRIKTSLLAHRQDPDQASVARMRALASELAASGLAEPD